jgi:hypothetical protein
LGLLQSWSALLNGNLDALDTGAPAPLVHITTSGIKLMKDTKDGSKV